MSSSINDESKCDGGIHYLKTDPKWSFAKLDSNKVIEVAEKNPISYTAGFYYWKQGQILLIMLNK